MTIIFGLLVIVAIINLFCVLTTETNYRDRVWLWDRKAYRAWKKAYNGNLYANPNECGKYEEMVGLGETWWGYVHIEDSDLICLLYKNTIETDDKIRVAVIKTDDIECKGKDSVVFTHFWTKHGDKLVERALPYIINNYKKQRNVSEN